MKKPESYRHERAKSLLKGKMGAMAKVKKGKSVSGLSGAAPTAFPISGSSPKTRMDKPKRYASGGGVHKGMPTKSGKAKTEVNIVIAGHGDKSPAQPMPVPAAAAPAMPPRPPMGMPPRPMPAPGGMPPRPGMARGGKVKEKSEKAAAHKSKRGKREK